MNQKPKILAVIPARYGSTRFPGKPLALIGNKTMIEWTYIQVKKSKLIQDTIVATDDPRIIDAVNSFGGKVVNTSIYHQSGTDRLIEVIENLTDYEIVLNVQGDEPGIEVDLINGVISLKLEHRKWEMTTAATLIQNAREYEDPNRVKVVFDKNFRALYFSRSLIPNPFKFRPPVYRHLGIYCYERNFLLEYKNLPESFLEKSESLEQLRALQAGKSIGVHVTDHSPLAVDTPEDLTYIIDQFLRKGLIQ